MRRGSALVADRERVFYIQRYRGFFLLVKHLANQVFISLHLPQELNREEFRSELAQFEEL